MTNPRAALWSSGLAVGGALLGVVLGYAPGRAVVAATTFLTAMFWLSALVHVLRKEPAGWQSLRPSADEWGVLVIGPILLVLPFLYLRYAGPATMSGQNQFYLFWFTELMLAAPLFIFWMIISSITRWNDTEIQSRSAGLSVTVIRWDDLVGIGGKRSEIALQGAGGQEIRLHMGRSGFSALRAAIEQHATGHAVRIPDYWPLV